MTRGRKPLPAKPFQEVTQEEVEETLADLANSPERAQETYDLGRFVGAAQTASVMNSFCAVAQIRAFEEIKKSKAFKHLVLKFPDGSWRPAQNIDEFCQVVFGVGYRVMQEGKQTLEHLGEALYEQTNALGLKRSHLRLLVSLPEDERLVVEEAVKSADKSEVGSLIYDLVEKLEKERAALREAIADKKAAERVSADSHRRADEAVAEMEKLKAGKSQAEATGESDRRQQLQEAFGNLQRISNNAFSVNESLSEALGQYYKLSPGPSDEPDMRVIAEAYVEKVGEMAAALAEKLAALKTANAAEYDEKQEWEVWAEAQEAAKVGEGDAPDTKEPDQDNAC